MTVTNIFVWEKEVPLAVLRTDSQCHGGNEEDVARDRSRPGRWVAKHVHPRPPYEAEDAHTAGHREERGLTDSASPLPKIRKRDRVRV